jgi:hypothetical protein
MQNPVPLAKREFSPDSVYTFDRQSTLTRSARDTRPTNAPIIRSKTPGPEFGGTTSSSSSSKYANTMKPRSKTPTDYEFSSNTLQNRFANNCYETFLFLYFSSSRSLQSVHQQYMELVVNLTLLRPT